jgi:hypothetical protein
MESIIILINILFLLMGIGLGYFLSSIWNDEKLSELRKEIKYWKIIAYGKRIRVKNRNMS